MAKLTRLGDLERAVMDHLWSRQEPQTVRQVHEALSARRDLAYTTVMTVLQRLAKKNLVSQIRNNRAHRYAPVHGRDELVAGLMVDAHLQNWKHINAMSVIWWHSSGQLRETSSVSALAFTILAVLLVGPTPTLVARSTWPLRAPRAAMVLWQTIALAAALSTFSPALIIQA